MANCPAGTAARDATFKLPALAPDSVAAALPTAIAAIVNTTPHRLHQTAAPQPPCLIKKLQPPHHLPPFIRRFTIDHRR